MNEELMTMGLVSKSKKKGKTYRYIAYYKNSEGKWEFYSSAVLPNTTLDEARKDAVKELKISPRPMKTMVVVTDEVGKELGVVSTIPSGYAVWEANGTVYNLSSNTGKISPYTYHRRG